MHPDRFEETLKEKVFTNGSLGGRLWKLELALGARVFGRWCVFRLPLGRFSSPLVCISVPLVQQYYELMRISWHSAH